MKQFEYIEVRVMPKRADGLASTYYRMTYQEKQRLKDWINTIVDEITEVCLAKANGVILLCSHWKSEDLRALPKQ